MHYVDFSENEFKKVLPSILLTQDEPFGSASIVAQWFVFREAKNKGMTVMLDGQGADEILGGYHWFFGYYFTELFLKYKWMTLIKDIISYRKIYKK